MTDQPEEQETKGYTPDIYDLLGAITVIGLAWYFDLWEKAGLLAHWILN